ncbi:DUF1365 domain-containing protein [Pseudomonas sp.]|uniref:DUF1365 domain-containing protein n=1 Tax=Pseudomonas sp. TaxID=306 RepID=UPI00272C3DD7|nr:DUF1365 domain-containing protein [Pseudomonas sp.]
MMQSSALYRGWIRHRRYAPKTHNFTYRLSLLWLNLDEQAQVFKLSSLWSGRWWSPIRFRAGDYLRHHRRDDEDLKAAAQRLVHEQLGLQLTGPVCLLTQVRSFGLVFNPASFFYCYDEHRRLRAIITEVSNTPWLERYCYVMKTDPEQRTQRFEIAKSFDVSPFLPSGLDYRMRFSRPDRTLLIHMEDWQAQEKLFDATLNLAREPLSKTLLRREAFSFPFMVLKTVTAIYWQALRLALKRIPIFDHQAPVQITAATTAIKVKDSPHERHYARQDTGLLR